MPLLGTIDMAEATRLTREGRLDEALSLLAGGKPTTTTPATPPGSYSFGHAVQRDAAALTPKALRPLREKLKTGLRDALDQLGKLAPKADLAGGQSSPVPKDARFENNTYTSAHGTLNYKLYVPSRAGSQPLPLVVMLHGCTQSPDDFALGTRMNELAEQDGCYVAYPAQTSAANSAKCWNWFRSNDQQRGRGEPALIAGMVKHIMSDNRVDADRVYVAGLSAGGAAAVVLGQAYPELFAAVGVHSGLACGAASDMPSAFTAMKQGAAALRSGSAFIPTIVFHGDRDSTVSPVNGEQVLTQAGTPRPLKTVIDHGHSADGLAYTRTVHSDGDRPMLEHWVLHGGGHAWSGGSPAGSYTDPRGPDASDAMLRFFKRHAQAGRA